MATFENQQFQQPWDYSLKDYLDNEVVIEKEPPDMQQSWAAAAPIPSESHHLRNPTIMQMHRIAPAPSHLHMQMFVQNCVQNHVANLDHIKQEPGTSFVGYGQQPLPVPAQSPGTPVAAATPDAAAYVPRMSVVSDDKNDDSGVSMKSPGDLTNSGRSTPNSVPRSADSPLQLSPPPSSREPTPDSIRSESNGKKKSPDDEAADPPAAKQRRKSTSTPKTPRFSSGGGPRPDPHKCPRCEDPPFSTQSKLEFAEHLTEHVCREDKDYDRIFRYVVYQLTQKGTAGTPEELEVAQVQKLICDREQQEMKRINQERIANGEDPLKEKSIEPGTYVPRITNQGNVKLTKCKHCDKKFLAKVEYWFHLKEEHMQKMKIMNCPNCDFITQFKHHLEYHLRNHAGSKPFKCDDCDYNCVNKSMLNSHKKSHSNIYQFRCLDCGYATKYLHSLKLHLRKYNHRPDQVLNSDGLPSPNAIVDVHGTRRGPKAKPRKDEIQELGGECSQSSNTSNASPTNMQNIVSTPMQPFAFNPIMPTGAPAFTPNFVPTSAPAITNGQPLMVNGIPAQFNPSFPTLPISNSQLSYLSQFPHLLNMVQNPFSIVTNDMLQRVIQHHQWTQLINNQQQQQQQQSPDNLSTNDDSAENQPRLSVSPSFVKLEPVEEVAEEQPEPVNMTTAQIPEEPLNMSTEAPLDLSKPDPTALELSIKVEAPKIFKSTNRRRKGTAPIRVEMKTERDSDLDTSNEYEMPSSTLSPPLTSGEDSTQAPSPMQESFVPKRRHSYNV